MTVKQLADLKQKLNNGQCIIRGEEMQFDFHDPAPTEEVASFEEVVGILPEDYKGFLRLHNGAVLYQPWYGGGVEIHSLNKTLELYTSLDYLPRNWLPIGYVVDQGYVIIDLGKQENYMIFLGSLLLDEAQSLEMNFDQWLTRLITTEGSTWC